MMGFRKIEPDRKGFRKVEPERIDVQVEEQNPIVNGLKKWINAPEETVNYISPSGFSTREITPEAQKESREVLAAFGLGALKLPTSRFTNLYNDPDIQEIMEEHKIATGAGSLTTDLLLLKGLGTAFKGLSALPQLSRVTQGLMKAEAVKRITESTKLGKRFLNFYEVDRYVRHGITNAAVFGTFSAIKEAGEPYEGQNVLTAASMIGTTAAWGAGLGVVTSIPNYIPRVVSSGVYGAATTLIAGGSVEDAMYNAALLAGFEAITGKGIDRNIQLRAIENIKKETYQYLAKTGMSPVVAEKQASQAISSMIAKCGGIDNVLKNNPATNMNYIASEIKKIRPKYKFKKPTQIKAPEVVKAQKPASKITEEQPKKGEAKPKAKPTDFATAEEKEKPEPKSVLDKYEEALSKKYELEESIKLVKDSKSDIKKQLDYWKQTYITVDKKGNQRKVTRGAINPEGYLKEELSKLPKSLLSKSGGNIDDRVDEFNELFGTKIQTEDEMIQYLGDINDRLIGMDEELSAMREELNVSVTKKYYKDIKNYAKEISRGIREGKKIAKDDILNMQKEITSMIKDFPIEAKDKAKMIDSIKNANTPIKMEKIARKLANRAAKYYAESEKNYLNKKINKELKTTKPVKKGQRRVGKYTYEDNKLFDELRRINKITRETASIELDTMPDEPQSTEELIKTKMLEYKAVGKNDASPQLYESLYNDLVNLKKIAAQSKDDEDFIKMLNREQIVEDALLDIKKIKGDKNSIKTKILNGYRKGFTNIWSMLNSIGGKKFADTYNTELIENQRGVDTYFKTKDITDTATKIYNEKNIFRVFESMGNPEFEIFDFDGLRTELNRMELIDIYNSIKNDKIQKRYYDTFGEDQINALIAKLTPEDMLFGDYLMDVVGEYRDIHNERHIEMTGRDLGMVENYWMATSEYEPSVFDDIRIQGETPSAQKERAKGKVIPVPKSAWMKAQKHIAQAEHVKTVSRDYEQLKRLFGNRRLKKTIENKFGENVYRTLMDQIDMMSLNKQSQRIDVVSDIFGKAVNNWVTAKIALNPSTFVRQLVSVGNYMENMPTGEWTKWFFEGLTHPEETFKFMWKNAPFLEARFNRGYSEALNNALDGAKQLSVNKDNLTKFLTSFTRGGDVTAIVFGGYPMIKAGKSFKEFEQATLRAQQSGLASSRSMFQNSQNPIARLFLAFKNTPVQYFRKLIDSGILYTNDDIAGSDLIKRLTIYGVIQPVLYALAGLAVKEGFKKLGEVARGEVEFDEDFIADAADEALIQILVNPVNAIPVLDDIATYITRKTMGKRAWKVFSSPLLDDIETGVRKMTKKKITAKDYFDIAASVIEPTTGLPIKTPQRYINLVAGNKKKKRRF